MATFKDFRNSVKPNWCPGCGDFSVQAAIQRAAANVGYEPNELAVISGIGCSGRISGYINSYGFHGIHGRALPIAQGLKMANKDLKVIASGAMTTNLHQSTSATTLLSRSLDVKIIT